MTGTTVRFRVKFGGKGRESRLTATTSSVPRATTCPVADWPAAAPATPIARLLALAHHIERLVEAGELKDYAEAARLLGMAKSHMTHVTNLLSLASEIQEAILTGELVATEHAMRPVCSRLTWSEQRQRLDLAGPMADALRAG